MGKGAGKRLRAVPPPQPASGRGGGGRAEAAQQQQPANKAERQRGERNPCVFREGEQVCTEANPACVCDPSLSWWRLPEERGALGLMQVLIWAVLGAVGARGHHGMVDG